MVKNWFKSRFLGFVLIFKGTRSEIVFAGSLKYTSDIEVGSSLAMSAPAEAEKMTVAVAAAVKEDSLLQ
jgi:hypothetical protein